MLKPEEPSTTPDRIEITSTWPFFVITTAVIWIGYVSALQSVESLREPLRLILLTAMVSVITALYWSSPYIIHLGKRRRALLVVVQLILAFLVGLLTPHHWMIMGLYPALLGLSIGLFWPDVKASVLLAVVCISLMVVNMIIGSGIEALTRQLPYISFMFAFVILYVVLFIRQIDARVKTQNLLKDLESAHSQLQQYATQVEQLTLSHERERMGRELHDTLAQGLAGLILQLEAIDGHLESDQSDQARAVLQQAMDRARSTLREARRAIQALRASVLEKEDLVRAVAHEIDQLQSSSGISCQYRVGAETIRLSPDTAQEVLRVVQESLSNVVRHARADHIEVSLEERDGEVNLVVEDDGIGFDQAVEQQGFGLAGMKERASRLGGELQVESSPGKGTKIIMKAQAS